MKKIFLYITFISLLSSLFYGCVPMQQGVRARRGPRKMVKIGLSFNTNSLELIPSGSYNIFINKKLKGSLVSGKKYKCGIYKGKRVVIAGQKIYDRKIYIKGLAGNEKISINGKKYRQNLYIIVQDNKFVVINELDLEDYVKSVLGKEISPSWPIEAIKAQAIAARTYTLANLKRHKDDGFNLCDTTHCQAYGGINSEYKQTTRATNETQNIVVTHTGKLASTFYHSTCGGSTENVKNLWGSSSVPYLVQRKCKYCRPAPTYKWDATISYNDITKRLLKYGYKVGDIKKLKIKKHTKSGRVKELSCKWGSSAIIISGQALRRLFPKKIKSALFKLNDKKDAVYFRGKGNGHGIGLCQYGAKAMAEKGYSYKTILRFYFKGTHFKKWQNLTD